MRFNDSCSITGSSGRGSSVCILPSNCSPRLPSARSPRIPPPDRPAVARSHRAPVHHVVLPPEPGSYRSTNPLTVADEVAHARCRGRGLGCTNNGSTLRNTHAFLRHSPSGFANANRLGSYRRREDLRTQLSPLTMNDCWFLGPGERCSGNSDQRKRDLSQGVSL